MREPVARAHSTPMNLSNSRNVGPPPCARLCASVRLRQISVTNGWNQGVDPQQGVLLPIRARIPDREIVEPQLRNASPPLAHVEDGSTTDSGGLQFLQDAVQIVLCGQ